MELEKLWLLRHRKHPIRLSRVNDRMSKYEESSGICKYGNVPGGGERQVLLGRIRQ